MILVRLTEAGRVPAVLGLAEIRARNKQALDRSSCNMAVNTEETTLAGDWAFVRGICTATWTPKAGGQPIFTDGKFLTILRKQNDGSWKIHRDCFNDNVPPS